MLLIDSFAIVADLSPPPVSPLFLPCVSLGVVGDIGYISLCAVAELGLELGTPVGSGVIDACAIFLPFTFRFLFFFFPICADDTS